MNAPELISVIVPVYNAEDYLERCLDSITGQTYANLEIIVVIDGATDRSAAIAHGKARQDSRIVVVETPNHGLGGARNVGLEHIHGTYVGFVDSDDWIEKDMYAFLYDLVCKNDSDIAVCSVIEDKGSRRRIRYSSDEVLVMKRLEALERIAADRTIRRYVCDKLFKVSVLDGLRFPEGMAYEDIAFTYKAFDRAAKVVLKGTPKYHYCIREGSISNSKSNPKNRYDRFITEYWMMQFMLANEIYADAPAAIVRRGVHAIDHLIEVGNQDGRVQEIRTLIIPFIPSARKRLGTVMRLRAWMICCHLSSYSVLYRLLLSHRA